MSIVVEETEGRQTSFFRFFSFLICYNEDILTPPPLKIS